MRPSWDNSGTDSKRCVVREERTSDEPAVRDVHLNAFESSAESKLVDTLRSGGKAVVSLVALLDDRVVGHILFSPVTRQPYRADPRIAGLAPMAVLPEYQGRGVGAALGQAGLDECREAGIDAVVVLGNPAYYGRFGFRRARGFGLDNENGVDEEFRRLSIYRHLRRCPSVGLPATGQSPPQSPSFGRLASNGN